jgi:hypothetical protein
MGRLIAAAVRFREKFSKGVDMKMRIVIIASTGREISR